MKLKKILAFLIAAVMIISAAPAVYAAPSTTTVDGNTFYEIGTADDLLWFAEHVKNGEMGINALLVNDISLSGINWEPIEVYSGIFDGGNHTISNLICSINDDAEAGLFSRIREGAVRNLTVSGKVDGYDNIGMIAAVLIDSFVYNCTAIGEINKISPLDPEDESAGVIGGLVGDSFHSVILNCGAQVDISVNISENVSTVETIGGLVGSATAIQTVCVLNSYSTGNIKIYDNNSNAVSYSAYAGGIAGVLADDAVNNYFLGEITDADGGESRIDAGYAFGIVKAEFLDEETEAPGKAVIKKNYYIQGNNAVGSSYDGNIDSSWTQAVSDVSTLLPLLNANLPDVEAIIVEHRDFLYDSAWADLVKYVNGESVSAATWEMSEGGFPVTVIEEEIPEEPEIPECDHMCHDGGFFWNIINFFQKLFGINKHCSCGAAHY